MELMQRPGYTLIEIIITIAITAILSVGLFKAFEAITLRSEKAKILSALSIDSQSALDQISILLYDRVPSSARGYTIGASRIPLEESVDQKILEWYGLASQSYRSSAYSGFVDMNRSDYTTKTLYSPDTSKNGIETIQQAKWGAFNWNDISLVFAQSFDEGTLSSYPIRMDTDNVLILTSATLPETIYEKYYLVDSAYAVARGADIDANSPCITALGIKNAALDNTLLLFYDYRPWKGESFCADDSNRSGRVSVLASNVNAFRAREIDGTIRLSIDMNRTVRGGNPIRLSKQKVVF